MEVTLFSIDGAMFLLRFAHFFAGITWIGILYYFNFIQGSFFNETEASVKSACIQKLVPRALWWFRWGAMFTFITGVLIIFINAHDDPEILFTSWGVTILTGSALGTLMWFNVWFVIWPAQKVVIQSATQSASGGEAIADAAARGARAGVASRTNTLFSIPLLFLMGAASHLPLTVTDDSKVTAYAIIAGIIILLLEINALKGKTGPMTTVKGVIHSGLALTIVFYILLEVCLQ